ncbi:MAG TPA: tetratricopeptide repeat protein [Candidatus Baltobacteraceae bacterium]|nr:tetratricopeptide repeat protein [Candidatus Baltobacteraceae bacterium]
MILARFPELGEHTVAPPALRPFSGISEAERELSVCCRAAPAPRTYAMLGNVLVREGRYVDALEAYRSAAELDPSDASAHWACAEIAHVLDDLATSRFHRTCALTLRRVYPDPLPVGSRTPILLLLRDAPYSVNTPLELILDRSRVAVHKYYVEEDAEPTLPLFALAFCAFGAAEAAAPAIRRVAALTARASAAFNDPALLNGTAREALAHTLDGIDGVLAAQASVVTREQSGSIAIPALVRPVDTHAGDGLAYLTDAADLERHLARFAAARYHVGRFIEYRSADGFYRKFRAIFVDGVAYPYHLAIAPQWSVHYQTSPMRESPALRAEERAFLEAPERVVPAWNRLMPQIARAIGLDYFGIDATVLPDGRLFVFEADAGMLVHDEDARDVFAYKRPHVARIREALHAAIAVRTQPKTL